jgi:hemoglobin-like flavoprotein
MSLNIDLLRASLNAIKPVAADFATHFYVELFELSPESRTLFANSDFEKQKSMLVGSLVTIVDNGRPPRSLRSGTDSLPGGW